MSAANVASPAEFLDRARTVARPGFNRWLVPPCALAIHLCIGMAYGFSVFWLPLSKAIGINKSVACAKDASIFEYLITTSCDWKVALMQSWIYGLFFFFLGSSAALWGGWLERVGPRKAGVVAAFCWCGGLLVMALGVAQHQLWIMWIGAAIGGIGLGLGYISPVSTLIKWFPDRRGMATGLAIMGFGGGAMIGSPLADKLMKHSLRSSPARHHGRSGAGAATHTFMMGGARRHDATRSDPWLERTPSEKGSLPAGCIRPPWRTRSSVARLAQLSSRFWLACFGSLAWLRS
jgi:MFS family permease